MTLNADQRHALLCAAREAIKVAVRGDTSAFLADRQAGAFVTLRLKGALRGCVGQVEGTGPFDATVRDAAVAAATGDPRFSPVRTDELPAITIEVSVLGPIEPCAGPGAVEVGRHGLVVDDGRHRGVLLPQVAVEWGWDSHVFVANVCAKVGLHPEAWKRGARLSTFEAEVFSEGDEAWRGCDDP